MTTKGSQRSKKKPTLCVYCGRQIATTMDHVVPRTLFVPPRPSAMVTVPACHPCNNDKSRYESYLRDVLVSDYTLHENPLARELFAGPVMRSVKTNRSFLSKAQATPVPMYTPGGLYLGDYMQVPIESENINYVFEKMARGLYFYRHEARLPQKMQIEVRRINQPSIQDVIESFDEVPGSGPYVIGDGEVFTGWYLIDPVDKNLTFWLFIFYKTIAFTIATGEVDMEAALPQLGVTQSSREAGSG